MKRILCLLVLAAIALASVSAKEKPDYGAGVETVVSRQDAGQPAVLPATPRVEAALFARPPCLVTKALAAIPRRAPVRLRYSYAVNGKLCAAQAAITKPDNAPARRLLLMC